MKINKNNLQIITLVITAFAIITTMISMLYSTSSNQLENNAVILSLAAGLVFITIGVYAFLIITRTKPKKYIYISYSRADKDIVQKIATSLENQFHSLSKYRFEVLTADSIPFGSEMDSAVKDSLSKSEIIIIIVSPSYIKSFWCEKEFKTIISEKKTIIPVVVTSFKDLSKLPVDMSGIKALSLAGCKNEKEIESKVSSLAKDLIKQRID